MFNLKLNLYNRLDFFLSLQPSIVYICKLGSCIVYTMVRRVLEGGLNNKMAGNRDVIKLSVENAVTSLEYFSCGI